MSSNIPAVAYYRMSSDKQEASIGDQRTAVEQYARERGYRIVREYADEGISGWKSEQRVEFQRLIADADRRGDFEAVLCWDQDRFSRFDPLEANHYWFLLDRAGVHLATVAQGRLDWRDLGGWLSASVMQHGKAQYVKDLARNVARGVRERKLAGRWFGPAPYGYRFTEGHLEIGDSTEIAVVRRIFDMRARGFELSMIANTLNDEGVPTPRRTKWRTNHVRTILDREAYRGNTVIGQHSKARFCKTTEEPIIVKGTHPAIVDDELWANAHGTPKFVRRGNGRGGSDGARLSGLLRCGRCGAPMYSVSVTGGNHYYLCANYHSKGAVRRGPKCGYCRVNRTEIEGIVFDIVRNKVLLGSRERLEAKIAAILKQRQTAEPDESARQKRQLAKLDDRIERATKQLLLLDPDMLPAAQDQLRAMKVDREALAAKSEPKRARRPLTASDIARRAWELPAILSRASAAEVRVTMQQIVDTIVLDFEPDEARSTVKRQRYKCVGGRMRLRSADAGIEGR